MKTTETPSYMTAREACDRLGYSRPWANLFNLDQLPALTFRAGD